MEKKEEGKGGKELLELEWLDQVCTPAETPAKSAMFVGFSRTLSVSHQPRG